jgi:hypothetical protein
MAIQVVQKRGEGANENDGQCPESESKGRMEHLRISESITRRLGGRLEEGNGWKWFLSVLIKSEYACEMKMAQLVRCPRSVNLPSKLLYRFVRRGTESVWSVLCVLYVLRYNRSRVRWWGG